MKVPPKKTWPKRTWFVPPQPLKDSPWRPKESTQPPKELAQPPKESHPRVADEPSLVPTFGVFCLLLFCFVSFSEKLPLGAVAAVGAITAAALRGRQFAIPSYYWWYLGYVAIGAAGVISTLYRFIVVGELLEVVKIALIGIAAVNVINTPRAGRSFVLCYLALFALFPVRGALYNYVHGITEFGRISWNFFFRNPNDLAMTCFLPLGLCAYVIFVEKRPWLRWSAWIGFVVITGVQMLTQSRGAILALGAGILYFAVHTKRKVRTLLVIGVLCIVAVAATPSHVWDRIAGLSKLASGNIAQVDPEGSAAGRSMLMHLAWQTAVTHPLLGIGLGAYPLENARIARNDPDVGPDERGLRDAHSTYIRAAAETGMFGGLCVLATVMASIAFCRASRKRILKRNDEGRWAMAILAVEASMVAYALGAAVNSAERSTFFILQFLIPCALAALAAPKEPERPQEPRTKRPTRRWRQRRSRPSLS